MARRCLHVKHPLKMQMKDDRQLEISESEEKICECGFHGAQRADFCPWRC